MTMIGQAQANGAGFARAFESGVGVLAGAKIMMEASRPLGASQFAFGQLAMNYLIQGGMMASLLGGGQRFVPEPAAQWSASLNGEHTGSIDLGDGYTLQLDERNSEITVRNAETGETTRIWGDPHVEIDGKQAYDFWGTTTFTLENGTKITIDTEQFGANPDAYVASQVTITKGDQAIVVDGISQNQLGDLEISMSDNGRAIDNATRDGFVLNENASGAGWRSDLTGQVATQADLDATKPGELYGPGSTMPSFDEIRQALSTFLFFGIVAGMADSFGGDAAPVGRPFFRPIDL
jgi:hypothetical protein